MPHRTSADIRDWLRSAIARELGVSAAEIDVHTPFIEFALDSLVAVQLSGQLADWLGSKISPMVIWTYPDIDSLSEYLAGRQQAKTTDTSAQPARDAGA